MTAQDTSLQPMLPDALYVTPVALVDAILAQMPPADLPIRNFVFPSFCAREMVIPAGALIVARRYMVDHLCICSSGQVTVWGDGVDPVVVGSPYTYHARAGVQRIGYFHAETTWTTIIPIDPTMPATVDPEEILDRAAYIPELPAAYIGLGIDELLALAPEEVRRMLQMPPSVPKLFALPTGEPS